MAEGPIGYEVGEEVEVRLRSGRLEERVVLEGGR